jgi:hypothetical protein
LGELAKIKENPYMPKAFSIKHIGVIWAVLWKRKVI